MKNVQLFRIKIARWDGDNYVYEQLPVQFKGQAEACRAAQALMYCAPAVLHCHVVNSERPELRPMVAKRAHGTAPWAMPEVDEAYA